MIQYYNLLFIINICDLIFLQDFHIFRLLQFIYSKYFQFFRYI